MQYFTAPIKGLFQTKKLDVLVWCLRRGRSKTRTGGCLEEVAEGEGEIQMGK